MADRADRRTIGELLARYELEPSLKDVYVEGPSDRALVALGLEWLGGREGVRVYDIDTVDVPTTLLETKGLPIGNKGRVVALADGLQTASKRDLKQRVVCIADRDLDGLLGECRDCNLLIYTDGLSLDTVLAHPTVITKLLSIVLLCESPSAEELMSEMLPILNERVLHRLAAHQVRLKAALPALRKTCGSRDGRLVFRSEVAIRRHLEASNAIRQKARFASIVEKHREGVFARPGEHVHIEDFLELLHLRVASLKRRLVPEYAKFRRFMFGLLEAELVSELPEIREVWRRLGQDYE